MRINSTDRYLQLVSWALETTIIPDLQSAASKGLAEIIRVVLVESRKREGVAAPLLRECISIGHAIELEVRAFLGEPIATQAIPAAREVGDDYASLSERHAALTARLSLLCNQLAARRREAPDTLSTDSAGDVLLRRVAEWEMDYYVRHSQLSVPPPAPSSADARAPLSGEFLELFLNEQQTAPQSVKLVSFQPLLGGYGKQTYICRLRETASGAESEIVVRKTAPNSHMSFGFSTLEQEFYLLRALAKTDFPSPHPELLASNRPEVDGSFYTMPRIRGSVAGSFLGGAAVGHSQELYLQIADLMARLHTIPIETLGDYLREHGDAAILNADVEECYRRNLDDWRSYTAATEFLPSPYLSWLFDWLDRHVHKDKRRPVLIHGDFNIHNVLAVEGKITGVLDWECAGFGAPEQDLAYIRPHISKHVDWTVFIERYHASGGPALNDDFMQFCLIYSAIRVNLGGNRLAYDVQRGVNWDIRYAMVDLGFTQAFMHMGLGA